MSTKEFITDTTAFTAVMQESPLQVSSSLGQRWFVECCPSGWTPLWSLSGFSRGRQLDHYVCVCLCFYQQSVHAASFQDIETVSSGPTGFQQLTSTGFENRNKSQCRERIISIWLTVSITECVYREKFCLYQLKLPKVELVIYLSDGSNSQTRGQLCSICQPRSTYFHHVSEGNLQPLPSKAAAAWRVLLLALR